MKRATDRLDNIDATLAGIDRVLLETNQQTMAVKVDRLLESAADYTDCLGNCTDDVTGTRCSDLDTLIIKVDLFRPKISDITDNDLETEQAQCAVGIHVGRRIGWDGSFPIVRCCDEWVPPAGNGDSWIPHKTEAEILALDAVKEEPDG